MKKQEPTPRAAASKTGSADAAEGSVAVSGIVVGDINLFTGVPVRTRYLEQVLRIVPPDLVGRDTELAELARFCEASEPAPPYSWWRADAWAGKSALMSWFVLNPPSGIRVVSFFITARFASQDDRGAFIENVLEQLSTLLGEPMPAYLTDSTRDAHLLGMLSDAARACQARGERLVLVVDGLDEDRGVTTGPHAYSIAALLPDPPPADMRIVVAGRRNPPIPSDVPQHHRLRDPTIVHPLTASPYAAVVRIDMEGELKRLLLGSQAEQDLLGLLTAARGGLSASDLAELTSRLAWQVQDELGTVTGRSFSARPSRWLPGIRPDVYVLGHEELQRTAETYLGDVRLVTYRQRLHAWADQYRKQGWPEDTPEYLLRGYYRMLMATGDLERMIGCATDGDRHDRMLDTSGGDDAALEEITAAMDVIVRDPEPDLTTMARLAVFRDRLADRNTAVPIELPAAWASLAQIKRAEALAGSIINPGRRESSLVELVKAVSAVGDFTEAQLIAQSITHEGRHDEAAMVLLRAATTAGDIRAAEALLQSIRSRSERTAALAVLAQTAAEAGNARQARDFIAKAEAGLSSTYPLRRGEALAGLAQAEAAVGNLAKARILIGKADVLARSLEQPGWRAGVWAALIRAVSAVESQDEVPQVIDEAQTQTRSIADVASRARAMASLARAAGSAGVMMRAQSLITEAEGLVRLIEQPSQQAEAWTVLLRAAAGIEPERARQMVSEAETAARSVGDKESRATALAAMARALTAVGEMEEARRLASEAGTLARSVVDRQRRGRDLTALVKAMVAAGILRHAEEIARSIPGSLSHQRGEALISVARAEAAIGDLEHAKAIASSIANRGQQAGALAALAKDAAAAGNLVQAREIAQSITSRAPKAEALAGLANGVAAIGELDEAETIALSIELNRQRSSALAGLAETAARAGKRQRAAIFAEQAEAAARSISGADHRAESLVAVTRAVAVTGNLAWARRVARSIVNPRQQGAARAAIVRVIVATGNIRKAESAALAIADRYWRAMAQIAIVQALTTAGENERAYRLARKIQFQTRRITDQNQRESTLISLVKAVAATGHSDEAEALIPPIAKRHRRAEAFIALSEIVAPLRASTLIARALQLDHWTTSLPALVQVVPNTLEVVIDEVSRSGPGPATSGHPRATKTTSGL